MKIEDYKAAMKEVPMSESRYNKLCELIDNPDIVRENKPAKKKIKRISIPLLIAAAILLTVGGTVAAAELSGNSILNIYFRWVREKNDISDMPVIDNVEVYGTEITYSPTEVTSVNETIEPEEDIPEKESARIVSAACDNYNIFAVIEYKADEKILNENIHEDTIFGFDHYGPVERLGISNGIELITRTDNVFSFAYHSGGIRAMPEDEINIELEGFGYYGDDGHFIPVSESRLVVTVRTDELNIQQSVNALSTVQIEGIEFEAKLSPLGMLLSADAGEVENWEASTGAHMAKYLGFNYFMFFMKDGSVHGDGESYNSVYGLIRSQSGWIDFDEGKSYYSVCFSVPLDISEIERISVHGAEFSFNASEADS